MILGILFIAKRFLGGNPGLLVIVGGPVLLIMIIIGLLKKKKYETEVDDIDRYL